MDEGAALSADEADAAEAALTPEQAVLEAFIAQHYIGVPVPPLLILSAAVDKALITALSAQSGVKISTVRTHVGQMYEKTGTHSQAQLVALLHAV